MEPNQDNSLPTVPLGKTGIETSSIQFGTWRFGRTTDEGSVEIDEERAYDLLDTYAAAGGRFIDTADVYGNGASEKWIGNWLENRDRDRFCIASKIYWQTHEDDPNSLGTNRKNLRDRIRGILSRLKTEYIDVLYIHRWDDATPARSLLQTLNQFVTDGQVHFLGASTLRPNAWKVARANEIATHYGWEPFTVLQPRYNLVDREIEGDYLEFARQSDCAVCPWSPLGQGFLTGKYDPDEGLTATSRASESSRFEQRYLTDDNFAALNELKTVAAAVDASPAQTALAWLIHREGITSPIVGARTVEQLEENLAAASITLNESQVEQLTASIPGPYADL